MTALLLNIGHAIDHLLLLVFATAVGAIAADFGVDSWESLMPYATGAFFMFGLGSLPSGRLGDLWGRRAMMLVFFFGIGLASIGVAFTTGPWSSPPERPEKPSVSTGWPVTSALLSQRCPPVFWCSSPDGAPRSSCLA